MIVEQKINIKANVKNKFSFKLKKTIIVIYLIDVDDMIYESMTMLYNNY